jgi:hypothetical protein
MSRDDNAPMNADAVRPISSLEIRMGVPDIGDDDFVYPVARLLIDGQDPLAAAGKFGHEPWPAHTMLTGSAPLLPADPPRRVVVYVESPDPGGLAALISRDGDVVVWSDFHEVYQAGGDPLDFSDAYSWSPLGLPDLVFDARQYTAEVERVTAAREWESDAWQAALLLRAYLLGGPQTPGDELTPGGEWEVGFTEPGRHHGQRYHVTYWNTDDRTVATVTLTAESGPPELQARAMYDYLLGKPAASWPCTVTTRPPSRRKG